MNKNHRTARTLAAYGAFLIAVGIVGFLSNPEKAKTALLSGGTFGLLHIGLGWLSQRGWRPAAPVALGVATFLAVVFTWRATVSWLAVSNGQPEKLVAAVLISSMLAATLGLIAWLWRARRRADGEAAASGAADA